MQCKLAIVWLSSILLACLPARADNWPNWRGPGQSGVAPCKECPVNWGEKKNIVWKVKIPGWGTSTPAIWGERIFLTCRQETKNALICLNRQGKKLWQVEFGTASANRNRKASGANPSPVTDGKHVYAYYKNGDLACVDFDGAIAWQMNLQEKYGRDRLWWDLGTSPVLTKKRVVVAVMHQGPSYLVALEKSSGKLAWKQDRDLDAPREAKDSYTTPLVIEQNGSEMVVVLGADYVTAHAADTGKELWRAGGLNPDGRGNFRSIASPVVAADMMIAPYARGETLTAIRLGGRGNVTRSHVAWRVNGSPADVPSPVSHKGRVYVCSDRGDVRCIEARTGSELWIERLPRNRHRYSSSPVIAGGRLYATREDGTTFVLKLGDKPELTATNALRENTYATPVFVDGRLYLRTSDYLFCIGGK